MGTLKNGGGFKMLIDEATKTLEIEDQSDIEANETALKQLRELIDKRLAAVKERREMKWKEMERL
jgi:hypothetical protein